MKDEAEITFGKFYKHFFIFIQIQKMFFVLKVKFVRNVLVVK